MFDGADQSLPVLLDMVHYVASIIGTVSIWFGTSGFMYLSTDPRSHSFGKPFGEIVFGGVLLANQYWVPLIVSSITADYATTTNILSSTGSVSGASPMEHMFKTIVMFAQILGVIAVIRGIHLFKKATNSSGQHGGEDAGMSGLMFVVFGSAAANMPWTLKALSSFMGFPIPSFLVS